MKDLHDYNLKGHNTFGMDVKCRRFIEFSTVEELQHIIKYLIRICRICQDVATRHQSCTQMFKI